MEENRGKLKAMRTYGRIISALTELRQGRVVHDKLTVTVAETFYPEFKFSKALGELFDLPDSLIELETGLSNLQV